jgi:hypothetical protein
MGCGKLIVSHDSTPSVLQFPLPTLQSELSDTPSMKRTKTESEEIRTITSKLSSNEYTNINQIEVFYSWYHVNLRTILLLLQREYWRHFQ